MLVPLSAWKVTRSSISALSPTLIGAPSSARIEVRRPTVTSSPRRTSPTMRANGSRTKPEPIVGFLPGLKLVRGAAPMPITAFSPPFS
jgi:hypothetical protein